MAVYCEFINLICPRTEIERCYPGGLRQLLADKQDFIGKTVWMDEHLCRLGAMDEERISSIHNTWQGYGIKKLALIWSPISSETSCDWLDFNVPPQTATLKGVDPGPLFGPARKSYPAVFDMLLGQSKPSE